MENVTWGEMQGLKELRLVFAIVGEHRDCCTGRGDIWC